MSTKNKPQNFSVALYANPNMPVMKTYFSETQPNSIEDVTSKRIDENTPHIKTCRYCLDVNYELTDELISKISESVRTILIED